MSTNSFVVPAAASQPRPRSGLAAWSRAPRCRARAGGVSRRRDHLRQVVAQPVPKEPGDRTRVAVEQPGDAVPRVLPGPGGVLGKEQLHRLFGRSLARTAPASASRATSPKSVLLEPGGLEHQPPHRFAVAHTELQATRAPREWPSRTSTAPVPNTVPRSAARSSRRVALHPGARAVAAQVHRDGTPAVLREPRADPPPGARRGRPHEHGEGLAFIAPAAGCEPQKRSTAGRRSSSSVQAVGSWEWSCQ